MLPERKLLNDIQALVVVGCDVLAWFGICCSTKVLVIKNACNAEVLRSVAFLHT